MNRTIWHLPWETMEDPPHALLDILRGCNISCKACYNHCADYAKSVADVEADLDFLMQRRNLHSVSLVGGEVTLHPDLCKIVRMVKSKGLCVEIFTNGVLLDQALLHALAEAGTDLIFLHVDSGQDRPDIVHPPSASDLKALVDQKAALVSACGIDVGLAITAYEDKIDEVVGAINTVAASPHLNYLLVTFHREQPGVERMIGDLHAGMRGIMKTGALPDGKDRAMGNIEELLRDQKGWHPFACIGSNVDENDIRWLSYLIATVQHEGILESTLDVRASSCERGFLALSRFATGRYPMYQRQNGGRLRLQLFLNAIMGGTFLANMIFLLKSFRVGGHIRSKRILFQCPAFVNEEGLVVHCKNCPDAVAKNGVMVPVCISDYFETPVTKT